MVIVIQIKMGSGSSHDNNVELNVTGLEPLTAYQFERTVFNEDGYQLYSVANSGSFTTLETDPEPAAIVAPGAEDASKAYRRIIYDIMGRRVSSDMTSLPSGIYIIDNGVTRATYFLSR